ncbi:unnamed protein product [Symbiodinium sp. CCMP2592]|nr:unnamed protein product [Symbiodinium sp. CCMP2592]CAE7221759.1 unnamed protein product [Symbiodinium sp. CCMP2592]
MASLFLDEDDIFGSDLASCAMPGLADFMDVEARAHSKAEMPGLGEFDLEGAVRMAEINAEKRKRHQIKAEQHEMPGLGEFDLGEKPKKVAKTESAVRMAETTADNDNGEVPAITAQNGDTESAVRMAETTADNDNGEVPAITAQNGDMPEITIQDEMAKMPQEMPEIRPIQDEMGKMPQEMPAIRPIQDEMEEKPKTPEMDMPQKPLSGVQEKEAALAKAPRGSKNTFAGRTPPKNAEAREIFFCIKDGYAKLKKDYPKSSLLHQQTFWYKVDSVLRANSGKKTPRPGREVVADVITEMRSKLSRCEPAGAS